MSRENLPNQPKKETELPKNEVARMNIKSRFIEQLRSPAENLIWQMKKEIDEGTYVEMLGDHASGHLPAILLKNVIDKANLVSGRAKIKVKFIPLYRPSGPDSNFFWDILDPWEIERIDSLDVADQKEERTKIITREITEKFIPHLDKEALKDKKILVVTDNIVGGSTIVPLLKTLKASGFKFDVATIAAISPTDIKSLIKDSGADNFYFGEDYQINSIYNKEWLAGVRKDKSKFSTVSKVYKPRIDMEKDSQEEISEKIRKQKIINSAREDINILADIIHKDVWSR
jgi:hypothetical protein